MHTGIFGITEARPDSASRTSATTEPLPPIVINSLKENFSSIMCNLPQNISQQANFIINGSAYFDVSPYEILKDFNDDYIYLNSDEFFRMKAMILAGRTKTSTYRLISNRNKYSSEYKGIELFDFLIHFKNQRYLIKKSLDGSFGLKNIFSPQFGGFAHNNWPDDLNEGLNSVAKIISKYAKNRKISANIGAFGRHVIGKYIGQKKSIGNNSVISLYPGTDIFVDGIRIDFVDP